MDDLEIPPDRAHLFDILDADGSADLEVAELVQGLLRVRGEARKSDVIGVVLAVRKLQDMVRQLERRVLRHLDRLCPDGMRTRSKSPKEKYRDGSVSLRAKA